MWSPDQYQAANVLARAAGDEMCERLELIKIKPRFVLDVGCGTGEISGKLASRFKEANIIALDHTPAMLNKAKEDARLKCIESDGTQLPFKNASIDIIFANFFLPWQTNMVATIKEWRRVLHPDGLLMFTALGPDTLLEWREVIHPKDLPELMDMHDLGDALLHEGFLDPILDIDHYTLAYRDQKKLISELCATGMWAIDVASVEKGMQGRILPLEISYELIYGHAFGAPIRNDTDPQVQRVPLSTLRAQLKQGRDA